MRAYASLDQFPGRASFATWLTHIAAHEALVRRSRRGRFDIEDAMPTLHPAPETPNSASDRERAQNLEAAIDGFSEVYRSVFVLREVEGLSTAETPECLGITKQTAKTRLHRARTLLRNHLVVAVTKWQRSNKQREVHHEQVPDLWHRALTGCREGSARGG